MAGPRPFPPFSSADGPDRGDGPPEPQRHWAVLLGPGPRLAPIEALLGALRPADGSGPAVRRLADIDGLLDPPSGRGRAVLDCDHLDLEDIGFVRRFLERHTGWDLVLTGDAPHPQGAKRFFGHPRVRWYDWPLDVDQLQALASVPEARAATLPAPTSGAIEPEPLDPADPVPAVPAMPELAEIEAILEPEAAANAKGPRPLAATPAPAPTDEPPAPGTGSVALPQYYRDQVADLADIAQGLELSVSRLREGDHDPPAGLAPLTQDVLRLVQFTRTLGYLVAPPPAGGQKIQVSTLLEELLSGLASRDESAPRYLYRCGTDLAVRSDKTLLVQAFDALLQLARACASAGDVVRVAVHELETDAPAEAGKSEPRHVEVRVSFPAGPLSEIPVERLLHPYALRRAVPEIGPNALAAAAGILRGQGGALAFAEPQPGRLCAVATLPAHGGAPADADDSRSVG